MMFAIDYKLCGFITCEFIEVDETRKTDIKHKQLKLIAFHKCMFIDFIFFLCETLCFMRFSPQNETINLNKFNKTLWRS